MKATFVIGVTGGIGSGKTTICDLFSKNHGIPIVDTDMIAREVVEPGQSGLNDIVGQFGREVLDDTGRLDRAYLKRIVFSDPSKRKTLENLLHPRIEHLMSMQVKALKSLYCLLCIPLLAEGKRHKMIDRVLVVDCSEALQISRVKARDNLTEPEMMAIMRSQASRKTRRQIADDIINNDGDQSLLRQRVEELHHLYVELAKSHK